ncbi:PIR protein [Plasmodium vivax]|uniref:VIR protein n=1 Tax=Plasmodium vivax TaxID=5855 RepID=A0A565A7L0_PLAVI|nr:PIR protein [Plasmodium vivax]
MSKPNDCSKSFPSEEFYDKLNEDPGNTIFYDFYCKDISSILKPDRRNIELCYKVVKYLIINAYDHKEKLACKDCNLLNYWVFDQIKSINGEDKTKINIAYGYIKHILSMMMKIYYKSNKSQCIFDIQIPYYQNWEAKKEFYEYCQDYKEINEKKDLALSGCEKYRDYLKKKPHLLANFEQIIADNK